jgi:hypothetical protein
VKYSLQQVSISTRRSPVFPALLSATVARHYRVDYCKSKQVSLGDARAMNSREDVEKVSFGEGGNAFELCQSDLRVRRQVQQVDHFVDIVHIDRLHVRIGQGIGKKLNEPCTCSLQQLLLFDFAYLIW